MCINNLKKRKSLVEKNPRLEVIPNTIQSFSLASNAQLNLTRLHQLLQRNDVSLSMVSRAVNRNTGRVAMFDNTII